MPATATRKELRNNLTPVRSDDGFIETAPSKSSAIREHILRPDRYRPVGYSYYRSSLCGVSMSNYVTVNKTYHTGGDSMCPNCLDIYLRNGGHV